MRARTSAAGTILAWLIVLAAASLPLGAQAPPAPAPARPLLEVPYLTQTPELCGGAALAMVLRFWGDRDVFAEDFAHLIDTKTAGIPTNVLATAAHNRGWSTLVTRASDTDPFTLLRTAVDRGHPVIALIEHAPRLYHYVVVVGLTDEAVVFHDPARAPYRVVSRDAFDRAWAVTDRWMLAVQRTAGRGEPVPSRSTVPVPAAPAPERGACGALVAQSVALAQAGETEAAERGLLAATRLCPGDAAPWRELSGLRFVARQWDAAAQLATTAVRLAPEDDHAWQLLATSEYLQGHWREALRAWNHVGQPLTDTITVTGAVRTRWPVITARLALTPRQLLTPDIFTRAARRLAALPVASDSQLRFEPTPDGRATIEAVIVERPVLPSGVVPLAFIGARAIVLDEVRIDVAGPTGSGELWSATWNWSETRPRLAFQLDMPSPTPRVPGIVSVGVLWERETYRTTRVDRRRLAVRVTDWAPRELQWDAGAAVDRLNGQVFVAVDAGVDKRARGDQVAVRAEASRWTSTGRGAAFHAGNVAVAWRSTTAASAPVWTGVIGAAAASARAPAIAWPGAGTGQVRAPLLRAHPLEVDGVIAGAAFGRRMVHASAAFDLPLVRAALGRLSTAVFVDAARAWRRQEAPAVSRFLVDIGAGLRVYAPGLGGGVRLDVAHGLSDGRRAVSLGWATAWPH